MTKLEKVSSERKQEIVALYVSGVSSHQLWKETGHDAGSILEWVVDAGYEVRTFKTSRQLTQRRKLLSPDEKDKICSDCKRYKPLGEFNSSPDGTGGVASRCAECSSALKKKKYAENPEPYKEKQKQLRKERPRTFKSYELKKKFKMTIEEHEAMFEAQGKVCAGCGGDDSGETNRHWHTDHDPACCPTGTRTCGKCVRGILCRWCNLALGIAKNDASRLRGLANYLENYHKEPLYGQAAPI